MKKLRVLDLFSGIGGFSLGLERTGGFETVAFCEIEEYPRKVLAKHWPKVPCYHDVRELTADTLRRDGIAVDVICGGFPCQDISFAGKGAGLAGERSGLWFHYARLIGELRPRFVIVENVAALLSRGLADVLGSLAALRYDAEWHCIPASAVGAPHRRDRLWIVANPGSEQHESRSAPIGREIAAQLFASDASGDGWQISGAGNFRRDYFAPCKIVVRNELGGDRSSYAAVANASGSRLPDNQRRCKGTERHGHRALNGCGWSGGRHDNWSLEPDVGRVAHGVPSRVDRLKALGNAVVPQVPELIGRAILKAEGLTP